jgi:hypothetical protein
MGKNLEMSPPFFSAGTETAPQPMWIDSLSLKHGFHEYNRGINVPEKYQASVDELLGRIDPTEDPTLREFADHQRRVGGYAGALLGVLYPEYDDPFHVGLIRIAGAIHDIGKKSIKRDVLYRSLQVPGYGQFDCLGEDMKEMEKHAEYGYEIIRELTSSLPPEAALIAGCHHQFADAGRDPYGVPLEQISIEFAGDEQMARWVRCATETVSLADYSDATSRNNNYFSSEYDKNTRLAAYIQQRHPDRLGPILRTLEAEKRHYVMNVGSLALAA